jgi:mono/diheme cytochrome c family protein
MLKRLLVIAAAGVLAGSVGYANQTNTKVTIPVTKTTPTDGKQMYGNYCAPCHGVDGRGNGPVAGALKAPPSDLTVLSRNNHGKFPGTRVITVLRDGQSISAHGSAQMPVWGPILGRLDTSGNADRALRISNLSRYLDTIQAK